MSRFHRTRPSIVSMLMVALIVHAVSRTCEGGNEDSVAVFKCDFNGDVWDVNYDTWPDRWQRESGPEYPHYVNIAIQNDDGVESKKCLRIDLDGAAAAVASPPIRVMSRFSYACEAQLKIEGLKYSAVVLTLEFRDAAGRVLQTAKNEPLSTTSGWQTVRLDGVEPHNPTVDHAVLGIRVVRGSKGDLHGHVSVANLRVERLPRVDVSTNNPCNVYTDRNGVVVECVLSGIREQNPQIDFQLLDGSNHELQREQFSLNGRLIVDKSHREKKAAGNDERDRYEGSIQWQPRIPDYGFYRVVVNMASTEGTETQGDLKRQLGSGTVDLIVVPPLKMPEQGEFGWTLLGNDQPLSFQELSKLLPEVGINWVKVPVWFDATDQRRGDELIRFIELLGASYIDVVGVVDRPPKKPTPGKQAPREVSIADVLSQDVATWAPSLEPVMSRLALRVRWWQLGRDYDNSLIGLPNLNQRIDDLRTTLFRFGQDVRLGMCADWEGAEPITGKVSWDFQQLTLRGPVNNQKFGELLAKERPNSAKRWISIDPPAPSSFPPQPDEWDFASCTPMLSAASGGAWLIPMWVKSGWDVPAKYEAARAARTNAFVHRLIDAKLAGADAIVVTKPFNDENGLMRADGMPAELLLPWRTTAAMLGGAQYLGRLPLPNESPNHVFLRPDGQVVMVVWNTHPTSEALFLGENVRQFDLLGRSTPAGKQGRDQVIHVGATPSFVLGLHDAIARWRMSVKFATTQVPSIFSRPHHNSVSFRNFFPQGVGGTVKVVVLQDEKATETSGRQDSGSGFALDRWIIEPPQAAFQLAAGAETKFPFDIKLKTALYGKQPVRIDFVVEADERLEFSVYDEMEVGTQDLKLEVQSRLDKEGFLIVEQRMTNRTDKLADFKCHLNLKGEKPQRMQVYRLGREVDRKVYRFPNGQKLLGKEMLLEIDEVNGQRVLKYKFIAGAPPKEESASGDEAGKTPAAPEKVAPTENPRPLAQLGS